MDSKYVSEGCDGVVCDSGDDDDDSFYFTPPEIEDPNEVRILLQDSFPLFYSSPFSFSFAIYGSAPRSVTPTCRVASVTPYGPRARLPCLSSAYPPRDQARARTRPIIKRRPFYTRGHFLARGPPGPRSRDHFNGAGNDRQWLQIRARP